MTSLPAWALLAALSAASAGALLTGPRPGSAPVLRDVVAAKRRSPRLLVAGGFLVLVGAGGVGLHGRHLALLVVLGLAAAGVLRAVERAREEAVAHQRRRQVVDYCEALVGELRAGQPTSRAVQRSVEVWPDTELVAAADRLDASVPRALRRLGLLPGAGAVTRLAAAWEISASTGSGLVVAVEQVLATARAEEATARLVRAELASARATARLVTALPVVVLLAAQGVGARPWHFLLDTGPGIACLGTGVALSCAGLTWIDRIGRRSVAPGGR